MLWEALFLLVILKIPVVYLCLVVWWAIKAEPTTEPPTEHVPVTDTPSPDPSRWSPRPARRRPAPAGRGPRRPVIDRPAGRTEVRR
jgi:hypothetical protein